MRNSLVTALLSCANSSFKHRARRFLAGLSCDELQFLAEYFGAVVLDSCEECARSRSELAGRLAGFERSRAARSCSDDLEHKMILLLEFLCQTGREFPVLLRSA